VTGSSGRRERIEGERGNVVHPGGAGFAGEERGGVSGEEERDEGRGGKGREEAVEAVGEEEVLEAGEVGGTSEMQDGAGEKGVVFVADREGAVGAATVRVREIKFRGREDLVSGEDAALAAEAQEGEGERQRGVGCEPVGRGEEVAPAEVRGGHGGVGKSASVGGGGAGRAERFQGRRREGGGKRSASQSLETAGRRRRA
jgi:hypothetical protein